VLPQNQSLVTFVYLVITAFLSMLFSAWIKTAVSSLFMLRFSDYNSQCIFLDDFLLKNLEKLAQLTPVERSSWHLNLPSKFVAL
jgi:hypothetical protein